jgi:hypothetical protein
MNFLMSMLKVDRDWFDRLVIHDLPPMWLNASSGMDILCIAKATEAVRILDTPEKMPMRFVYISRAFNNGTRL